MADFKVAGDALAVAEVQTVQVTAYHASTTYSLLRNGKSVTAIAEGTVDDTAAELASDWNDDENPEMEEATAEAATDTVTLTADEAGKPIPLTTREDGGTGTIGDPVITTAAKGPSVLCAENCKNVATGERDLPTTGDSLTLEQLDIDLKYHLDALAAVTLTLLSIEASFTGQVALAPVNEDASDHYDEDRVKYLTVGATSCVIGGGDSEADGSGLIAIDFGAVLTNCLVIKTDDADLDGLHAFLFKGTNASNVLRMEGGSCDVAPFAGELATILTATIGGDAELRTSKGVTLGTVNALASAEIEIDSAAALADITAINIYDQATVTIRGDNGITAINVYGKTAKVIYLASGTIAAVNLIDGATFDCKDNPNAFTISTLTGSGQPTITDPNGRMTITNPIDPKNSDVFDWKWDLRPGRQITLGSP